MTRAATQFKIKRFDPQAEDAPHWESYAFEAKPKMSVLDGLFAILESDEGALGFRYSCRAGMCGSCAMIVNGRERLACRTRLAELPPVVSVEPLRSLPVIKDLVVDMAPFFEKYRAVDPFYVGEHPGLDAPVDEPQRIDPHDETRQLIDQQIDCISCGACYSACPVVAVNAAYLGPAALNRAYALAADRRDAEGAQERLTLISGDGGAYACHSVGNCVTVCPAGVDPLLSIRRLRKHAIS